jgi:hypothetical protein
MDTRWPGQNSMKMAMKPTGWSLKPVLLETPKVTVLHRAKVVIYDLKKNIRYTLTQPWDRSVEELAVRSGILSSSGTSTQRLAVLPGFHSPLPDCR